MLLDYYKNSKAAEETFEVEVGKDIGIIHNQVKKVSTESGLNWGWNANALLETWADYYIENIRLIIVYK